MNESKRKYYNDYFKTNLKNIKNTWKSIKSIISLKCKDSDIPHIIKDKGIFLTAPKDIIANSFDKFFCLVAPSIQSKINLAYNFFNHFLKNPCHDSFFIKPCTNKEIIDISDLSCKKATGPNSIPIKIMKPEKDCIANNLSVLFNLSSSSGIFPDKLKIDKILPVFKKGCYYRPLSLISNLDKIIEKLMHKRRMEFLNEQKILYCKHYRFRKGFFRNCSCYN